MLVRPLPLHVHRVPQVLPGVPLLCRRDHQGGTSESDSNRPARSPHRAAALRLQPKMVAWDCRPPARHLSPVARQVNENKLIVKGKLDLEDVQLNKGGAGPVPATMARAE